MSIRDIIDAATPGPWWAAGGVVSADNEYATSSDPYVFQVPIDPSWDNATFAATFNPKHVALMEAERVAAREFITDRASGVGFAVRKYDAWVDACEATDRYRKERGL
ncbi:MAG: hypothetical protein RBR38_15050 [Desulfomicrobium apsheronum]|nr:hypothetical protein [Desulfomicrobium apsheronum]